MNHDQKNKLLDQIRIYFLTKNELALPRAQFEFVLKCERVSKDSIDHYIQYGYTISPGKKLLCK